MVIQLDRDALPSDEADGLVATRPLRAASRRGETVEMTARERLARELEAAGAPPTMLQRARDGYYDEAAGALPAPVLAMVCRDVVQAVTNVEPKRSRRRREPKEARVAARPVPSKRDHLVHAMDALLRAERLHAEAEVAGDRAMVLKASRRRPARDYEPLVLTEGAA
jgi:hypothetical protein